MDVYDWVQMGIKNGWCSDIFCMTHDTPPVTAEEDAEGEDGYDFCVFCVRVDDVSEVVVP